MAEEDLTLNIRLAGGKQAIDELTEILRLRNAVLGGGSGGGGGSQPIGGGRTANVGPANFPQSGGLVDVGGRPLLTNRIDPGMRQAMRPVAEAVVAQTQQALVEEVRSTVQRRARTGAATSPGASLADRVRQQIASGRVEGLAPEVIEQVTGAPPVPGVTSALERQRSRETLRAQQQLFGQRETVFRREGAEEIRQARLREQLSAATAEFDDPSLSAARRGLAGSRAARAAGRLGQFGQQADLQERLADFRRSQRPGPRAACFGAGPLARFNQAAFGPAIAGLSLQFGLLPAFQANQQIQQAGLQFGPFDARRAGQQQAIAGETTRLGTGALQAQNEIDRLTLSLLRLANAVPGAGQALAVVAAGGGALTAGFNLAGPVVGAAAALTAGRAAQTAAGQAATFGAGALAAGAFGIAGLGMGAQTLAAGAVQGAAGSQFGQAGELGALVLGLSNPITAPPAVTAFAARQFMGGGALAGVTQEPAPVALGPAASVIRARTQAEAQRRAAFQPQDIAAENEVQARLEARIGLQQQRFGLDIARQQFQIGQTEFAEDQAFARRRLRTDFARAGEDIAIGEGRAARDLVISRGRRERDIGIGEADQITDIRVGAIRQRGAIARNAGRQREDIGIGLGQALEDIDIGAGESREDINRGFGRGFRNLIFGQIGGLAGGVLGLAFSRQDALEDVETGRGRAIRQARRGAGRAGAAVGRGERRALEDVGVGEGEAISDTRTGASRQRAALGLGFADQAADIATSVVDALEDAGKSFTRASKDLNDVQTIQITRQIRNVAIQQSILDQQEALWKHQSDLIRDANLSYEQLVRRLNEIITSLGGVPERIDRHIQRSLAN